MRKISVLTMLLICVIGPFQGWTFDPLEEVEKKTAYKYRVPEITIERTHRLINGDLAQKTLLFDVREPDEYADSHIKNALLLSPDTSLESFLETYGDALKDNYVIFYCSVGDRSSSFLKQLLSSGEKTGARALFNLRGGIFRWYNAGYDVYNTTGVTDIIHPYDANWGRYLTPRTKPDKFKR